MFDPCPGGCLNDCEGCDDLECLDCAERAEDEGMAEGMARRGLLMPGLSVARNDTDEPQAVARPGSLEHFAAERARRDADGFEERGLPTGQGEAPGECTCRVHCPPGQNGKGTILEPSEMRLLFSQGSVACRFCDWTVTGTTAENIRALMEHAMTHERCPTPCQANPMDCPGPAEDGACLAPKTTKERGVLATVRRWWQRVIDRLTDDPWAGGRRF
jgi:hypothetical protein